MKPRLHPKIATGAGNSAVACYHLIDGTAVYPRGSGSRRLQTRDQHGHNRADKHYHTPWTDFQFHFIVSMLPIGHSRDARARIFDLNPLSSS
jgi:hypothetical protein